MHVALLEPPATDPRSPHLAMACLHAALALDGTTVEVIDGGAEALHWLLRADRVERAFASLPGDSTDPALAQLRRLHPLLVAGSETSVGVLRDRVEFFDPAACDEARETIAKVLAVHSFANGRHRYGIAPIHYGVAGADAGRLEHLEAVTRDPSASQLGGYYTEVAERLDSSRPAVVAVSILNHQQIIPGLTLARLLRGRGHRVVIGGTVYAKFVDALRARPAFFELFCDAVCVAEGETALRALVAETADAAAAGRPPGLAGIPNLLWLDPARGTVEAGPVHAEDVASLPAPNFDGFDLGLYLTPEPVLPILTGKGCYFNRCKFCDIPYINRLAPRPYRRRSAERVAADIASLWHRYGAHHFVITDEALAPRFLLQIGEALAAHPGVDPRLVGYARFEAGFTRAVCEKLYDVGVRRLFFGLESGSQLMLDHMDKGVQVDVAHRVVRDCAASGIGVHLFSMVGLPEEQEQHAQETLAFLLADADVLDHPRHTMDVHRFNLDLRTDYFEHGERYGIEIDRAALDAVDFPLDAPAWRMSRGLSDEQADGIVARFSTVLRDRFRRSRVFPAHIYPSFEEYSVLYADRFDRAGGWPLRFALPDDTDPAPCTLRWSRSLAVSTVEGGVLVSGPTGERPLSAAAYGLLRHLPGPAPAGQLIEQLVARLGLPPGDGRFEQLSGELRSIIDDLLAAGVLRADMHRVEVAAR